MSEQVKHIQAALMQVALRAEKVSQDILTKTFVDAEPLMIQLSTRNNQVLYGRRGTGKTHALKYLADKLQTTGSYPIYIDMRTVGSNGSIYADQSRPLQERASRLIIDVLESIESELFRIALDQIDSAQDPKQITLRLDDLGNAIRKIVIEGTAEQSESTANTQESKRHMNWNAKLSSADPSTSGGVGASNSSRSEDNVSAKDTGKKRISLDFGTLQSALAGLSAVLGSPDVWLLIDEWSEVPRDLQPYLADLLRRTILAQERIIVKIAAIEHRSNFAIRYDDGDFIGVEIGADMTADINLDDFVVYDVDQSKATEFFKSLIFNHYRVSDKSDPAILTAQDLIGVLFTQVTAFQEFVRAVEGVPRDALNLAALMCRISYGSKVSVEAVRRAAREWYQQDKMAAIKSNPRLGSVLSQIIDEVIGTRRARAFLFPVNVGVIEIDQLYDARLLHILKKSVSSNDEPGKRFDVYKIDYGCYVDLITTTKAPTGLLEAGIDVPPDDYRAIRRAILRPEMIDGYSGTLDIQLG